MPLASCARARAQIVARAGGQVPEAMNEISHRAAAARRMRRYLDAFRG